MQPKHTTIQEVLVITGDHIVCKWPMEEQEPATTAQEVYVAMCRQVEGSHCPIT